MVSSRGNCEIIEVKDGEITFRHPRNHLITQSTSQNRDHQRPPTTSKRGPHRKLEDDINKLFKSVNVMRSAKTLDLSGPRRNPSKKPMRSNGPNSPVYGFSEPVSLKQALRGMCISQAAELAAIKRSSLPSSPRISEFGKITGGSFVEESASSSRSKSANQSSCSSPIKIAEQPCNNMLPQRLQEPETAMSRARKARASPLGPPEKVDIKMEEKDRKQSLFSVSELPCNDKFSEPDKKPYVPEEAAFGPNKVLTKPLRTFEKPNPKARRNFSSENLSVSKSVKGGNVRILKPVVRKKKLVVRRSKKVASSSSLSKKQLICEKCQCSLSDTGNNNNNNLRKDLPEDTDFEGNNHKLAAETENSASKSSEKVGISQSSKSSSFYDLSTTTTAATSPSEDSHLSGSSLGSNKPHMSKDAKWEAIDAVRKRHGFLGLSHFDLLKKLGSGDIGTVYLAELAGSTGWPFAVKVMDNGFLERRNKMVRAKTEREILEILDHPFLPTLYARFTSDDLSCLVMEFCPGGDLHVLRQKQPGRCFTEEAARFYVAEVLLALEYLHMLGIVYRDLKPENILVREDGHIMLSDFDLSLRCSVNPMLVNSSPSLKPPRISGPCVGPSCTDPFCNGPSCKVSCFAPRRKHKGTDGSLPQLVAEPTEARSNSFVGTHEYLAPEIIRGDGHGSSVDWWTLGVFLYELLYGKTPFKGSCNEETLANVVMKTLEFPDSPVVSFRARDLIRGLLVKEPEGRLGAETGAAVIKRHSFFEGLNWALIRCAGPPCVPGFFEVVSLRSASSRGTPEEFVECGGNYGEEHGEFELF